MAKTKPKAGKSNTPSSTLNNLPEDPEFIEWLSLFKTLSTVNDSLIINIFNFCDSSFAISASLRQGFPHSPSAGDVPILVKTQGGLVLG